MKRIILISFLLINTILGQHKFAWIFDLHIGYDSADVELSTIVGEINSFNDLSFLLVTGDLTEKSKNSEFDIVKSILDKVKIPLLIIPGNHDSKWSNSGCAKFIENWDDDKFFYRKDSTIYIGLNSAIPLKGGGGHIKPEDLQWLKEELNNIKKNDEIILAIHHPLNEEIDNWFKLDNIIRNYNIKAILFGHNHDNKITELNGIPSAMCRSTLSQNKNSYGFNIVENGLDSLRFFEVDKDTIPRYWGSISKIDSLLIPEIDSTQFINYNADISFQKDIKTTLLAPPLFANGKIYVADYTGLVRCFNKNGKLLWDYDAFGDITAKPLYYENKIIITTVQGEITLLNANNGDQIETIGFDDYIVATPLLFNHKGRKNLIIPKQTNSNAALLISTTSGKIYCYDLETLQEIWKNEDASDMIENTPLLVGNQIIFGSWDTYIYSLDASSGTTIWKWQGNKSFYYSPAACNLVTDKKYIYFTTPDGLVYSVDLRLGITKWKSDKFNAWESIGISENGKELFIKSKKDKFYVVKSSNGKIRKKVNINFGLDTMPTTPIEWNKRIIFSSKNGYLYRINRKFRYKSILFLGTARLHSVQKISDSKLMASNMDGKIVIFNIVNDK